MAIFKVRESLREKLIETYDFKELRFDEETDEAYYFDGVNFMQNRVWVKVIIDDEVSLWDWDVYEQDADDIYWVELGTVSREA